MSTSGPSQPWTAATSLAAMTSEHNNNEAEIITSICNLNGNSEWCLQYKIMLSFDQTIPQSVPITSLWPIAATSGQETQPTPLQDRHRIFNSRFNLNRPWLMLTIASGLIRRMHCGISCIWDKPQRSIGTLVSGWLKTSLWALWKLSIKDRLLCYILCSPCLILALKKKNNDSLDF